MIFNELEDVLRVVNFMLAALLFAATVFDMSAIVHRSREYIMSRLAIAMFGATIAVSSYEQLTADAIIPGIRTELCTIALVWALVAIWFDYRDSRRNH